MNRVEKPWGYELHWAKTDKYVGKLIHVNAGHALSLQYHNQKDETIFLWSGRMLFEIKEGDELVKREMKPGEAVHVTPKTVHRMTAIEDCDIFEVSTPELHDVVRLEDRYGRSPERPGCEDPGPTTGTRHVAAGSSDPAERSAESLVVRGRPVDRRHLLIAQAQIHRQLSAMMSEVHHRLAKDDMARLLHDDLPSRPQAPVGRQQVVVGRLG